MPIVRIELLAGRSPEIKAAVAREITDALHRVAAIAPEATTVVFADVAPHDWAVAGEPLGKPQPPSPMS